MSGPVLSVRNLSVAYGATRVLDDVTFSVDAGACLGLVGESGCGKSTVALAAMRALARGGRITGGSVWSNGQDLALLDAAALRHFWATRIAMVYQDPSRALNPTLTVGTQVMEAFTLLGIARADARARAEAMLARVQIAAPSRIMEAYPHQLSGGMQQRVVIAMALAKDPALLVLDEPTTGLDATVEAAVLDLVAALRRDADAGILLISHNLPVVARLCDRIGVLYAGRLVEEGPADAVLQRPRHPYTESLVRCLPDGVRRKRDGALQTIPGQLPPPGAAIPGCVFAPRCFAVEAKCNVEAPPARNTAGHRALCHFDPPFRATGAVPDADMAPWPGSSAPASGSALRAVRLSKTYRGSGGPIRVVRDVSFDLGAGETLGLVGESGSGKTTLARLMLGLAVPDAGGHFEIGGHTVAPSLTARTLADRKAIQIVFQNPDSALNRAQSVRRILMRPLRKLGRLSRERAASRLEDLARGVRLQPAHLALRPGSLSGGLKQRVAIARAFAGGPRVVVCDEPTSALDASVQAAILNLLAGLQRREGVSYVFISHDLNVVRYIADRIAVLYLGRVVEIGPADAVISGPHHPYTEVLLSAVPRLRGDGPPRIRLQGEVPSAAAIPSGCVFQTRCPRKFGTICETEEPALDPATSHGIRCHLPVGSLGRQN